MLSGSGEAELFTVWLSSNFPAQQCEAISEHFAPSFKQKSTFSTQLKQFAQLHYLCFQQILRIVKIFCLVLHKSLILICLKI